MKKQKIDNPELKAEKAKPNGFFMDALIANSMHNAMRMTELIIENRIRENIKIEDDVDIINIYSNAFSSVMYIMYESMRRDKK
jgi:hypothetical protein